MELVTVPGVLLLHAAHHHAEMAGLTDHPTPMGSSTFWMVSAISWVSRSWTCSRRANMSTMRGILLSPITLSRGQIGDVHLAEERQQVVLAHAEELDVLHDHHLVVLHVEQSPVDDLVDVHRVAAGEELQRPLGAQRRAHQAFALGIFTQLAEDFPHRCGDFAFAGQRWGA